MLLAHVDQEVRGALVARGLEAYTPQTHIDAEELEKELLTVLEQGYATTYGELELGLNALAVPVRNEDGTVVAALSVSGPAYRLSRERIDEVVGQVESAGIELARRLGYWGDEHPRLS